MFVSDEIVVPVGFAEAQARLETIMRGGDLLGPSADAYDQGLATTVRVGPAPMLSRLVEVQFMELVTHGDACVLTLRWQVAGAGGGLFPVLDADISIRPAGDGGTLLRLDGSYRPPLGMIGDSLDRAILHRVADATIRAFLTGLTGVLTRSAAERGR